MSNLEHTGRIVSQKREIMGLQRGERQTQRTKKALETAFVELIREKGYNEITIGDIADRANTGRSTFYRYFQTKADVLVSLHEAIFSHFSLGLSSASDWLANEPPSQLVTFLQQYQQYNNSFISLSYKLGKDIDYVLRNIDGLLTRQFEKSLHRSFSEAKSTIPFELLAQSIASTYNKLMLSWLMEERRTRTAHQIAEYIHRLTRATIREAFDAQARCE